MRNRIDVDPVVQAAVSHAQFELVHPFGDANGRVGRIIISWLLVRRLALLTPPPVSTRLAADVGGYAAGLTLFRLGQHDPWVRWFADAVSGAGRAQRELVGDVDRLRSAWRERLAAPRGRSRRLRADSATWRVLDLLPRRLVLTAAAVATEFAVPAKTAQAALRELVAAGVLTEYGGQRGDRAEDGGQHGDRGRPATRYVCDELLGLAGSPPLRR
jgi:Fic family protein